MLPEEDWKQVRRKGSRTGKSPSGNDANLTSFYVSNLHGGTARSELWGPCAKLGELRDVYVAGRKDRAGSFFAFEIEIRGKKITANCAKHPRAVVKKTTQRTEVPNVKAFRPVNRGTRSFADVTKGIEMPIQNPEINLDCVPEIKNWSDGSVLIGEVRSLDVLCNFPSLLGMEGFEVVDIKYLGGLQMSMKFRSVRAAGVFKANKGIWLKKFVWVDVFGKVRKSPGRIAWVKIVGIPSLAWDEANFAAIAGSFGRVLSPFSPFAAPSAADSNDEDGRNSDVSENIVLEDGEFVPETQAGEGGASSENSTCREAVSEAQRLHGENQHVGGGPDVKNHFIGPFLARVEGNFNYGSGKILNPLSGRSSNPMETQVTNPVETQDPNPIEALNPNPAEIRTQNCIPNLTLFFTQGNSTFNPSAQEVKKRNGAIKNLRAKQTTVVGSNPQAGFGLNRCASSSSSKAHADTHSATQVRPNSPSMSMDVEQTLEIGNQIGFQFGTGNRAALESTYGEGVKTESRVSSLPIDIGKWWGNSSVGIDFAEAVGLLGGLISFWDRNVFQHILSIKSRFFLACVGYWNGVPGETILVNVYAPQAPADKRELWSKLHLLMASRSGTWILFGDFNAVQRPDERLNSVFCPRVAQDFNEFINSSGLIDLNMGDRKFTYFSEVGCKLSKIDRFLLCSNVLSNFPTASVTALPREHSDHSHNLLRSSFLDFGKPSFRFFNSWLLWDGFEAVVFKAWDRFDGSGNPDRYLFDKLKFVKEEIKIWRRAEFDKETKKLADLRVKVNDIETLCNAPFFEYKFLRCGCRYSRSRPSHLHRPSGISPLHLPVTTSLISTAPQLSGELPGEQQQREAAAIPPCFPASFTVSPATTRGCHRPSLPLFQSLSQPLFSGDLASCSSTDFVGTLRQKQASVTRQMSDVSGYLNSFSGGFCPHRPPSLWWQVVVIERRLNVAATPPTATATGHRGLGGSGCTKAVHRYRKNYSKSWEREIELKPIAKFSLNLFEKLGRYTLAESRVLSEGELRDRREFKQNILEMEKMNRLDLEQKARIKWMCDGDENTAFFHSSLKIKNSRNTTHGLMINGSWVTDTESIKEEAVKFFSSKFREPVNSRPAFLNSNIRNISAADSDFLEAPFEVEEIKNAVWSCGSDKAPGPDGFSFKFIKHFWDLMHGDIMRFVRYFEEHGRFSRGCNSSFISLLPMIKDPLVLSDYRPISLIGCVYKIMAKTLAIRLKGVVGSVIGDVQTAFLKGRNILDGPMIINEVCSWAKKSKQKLFLLKVDFDKAFDSINWDSLDSVLLQMGFGVKWRGWIRGCIYSARASVILNGSPTKEFPISRGSAKEIPYLLSSSL
ncbi:hypothetical protein LXL04_033440 [Taraxacum kok-saghyz]